LKTVHYQDDDFWLLYYLNVIEKMSLKAAAMKNRRKTVIIVCRKDNNKKPLLQMFPLALMSIKRKRRTQVHPLAEREIFGGYIKKLHIVCLFLLSTSRQR
jgi:hypothetical protein